MRYRKNSSSYEDFPLQNVHFYLQTLFTKYPVIIDRLLRTCLGFLLRWCNALKARRWMISVVGFLCVGSSLRRGRKVTLRIGGRCVFFLAMILFCYFLRWALAVLQLFSWTSYMFCQPQVSLPRTLACRLAIVASSIVFLLQILFRIGD